jgi:hypothetical protein
MIMQKMTRAGMNTWGAESPVFLHRSLWGRCQPISCCSSPLLAHSLCVQHQVICQATPTRQLPAR